MNRSAIITTRSILYGEIAKVIELDRKVMAEESSLPANQLPPLLTYAELDRALSLDDCLAWIYYGNELAGYYWFERKPSYLYIAAIVIRQPFQGRGLSSHMLHLANKQAADWQLAKCKLAVHPINGPALSASFKHHYRVVSGVSDFFGPAFPNSFRLIMEKNLNISSEEDVLLEAARIPCYDYPALKRATDDNLVGVELMRSTNGDNDKNCIIFKNHKECIHALARICNIL